MEIQPGGKTLFLESYNGTILGYLEIEQNALPLRTMKGYLVFKDIVKTGSSFDIRLKQIGYVYRFFPSSWGYKSTSKPKTVVLGHASGNIGYSTREDAVGALIDLTVAIDSMQEDNAEQSDPQESGSSVD